MKAKLLRLYLLAGVFLAVSDGGSGDEPSGMAPTVAVATGVFPQLAHVLHMGQSLGSGDDAFPVVTTADTRLGNFQFARGVHTWREQDTRLGQQPWLRPPRGFRLVPIVAGEAANSTGETIASGLVDSLKLSIDAAIDTRFLFSFSGTGSKRLRDLDKDHDHSTDPRSGRVTPGGFYKTSLDDVRRAKAQASARGWSYGVTAITWMQGERNNDMRLDDWTDPLDRPAFLAAYASELIALKNAWNADILAITGQTRRIPLFSYQTWGAVAGQAQLLASDQDPEIFVVSPTYYMASAINSVNPLNGLWGNWIHLNGESERWLGAQFAKVIKRVLVDGEKWQPLRPLKAWAGSDRKTVYVQYHVPRKPIVLDRSFLPDTPGAGLFIRGGPAVLSATVFSTDTLALQLASALAAGSFALEYASTQGHAVVMPLAQPVIALRAGSFGVGGRASYDLILQGDLRSQLATVMMQGVFTLQNNTAGKAFTSGTIRSVFLDANGNTVLRGEVGELRNGVPFQPGQTTQVLAIMPFGNVRDSDPEVSHHVFTAGPRAGQAYPLWNWSVGFQDLPIGNAP